MLNPTLEKRLSERASSGILRTLTYREGLIDFTSNDYFGLATSATLFREIESTMLMRGLFLNGSTGSRLLSGNSPYAEEVETMLAEIFLAEKALIFNSGYAANIAVLSALPQRNDTILYDELSHASIRDGVRLSMARHFPFHHNDLNDLEAKLSRASGGIYVVAESIYSMEGDACPLEEMVGLVEKYGATLILDEAHSTGIFGPHGGGLAAELGLAERIDVRLFTFGKAMGIHGACVAGPAKLQAFLINFARPFIYTTAPPAHSLAAIESSFRFLANNIQLQDLLKSRIANYCSLAADIPELSNNAGAIQTVAVAGNERARRLSSSLQQEGLDVRPILSPTVPAGTERLRVCLHTFNSREEINTLVNKLKDLLPALSTDMH